MLIKKDLSRAKQRYFYELFKEFFTFFVSLATG